VSTLSIPDINSVVTLPLTTGDTGVPATYENMLFHNVNIHCYAADAYYGDGLRVQGATQSSATPTCSIIRANGVVWFEKCYIKELFFKSYVNATPAYIVITGTL
jgi:hypothetical protein